MTALSVRTVDGVKLVPAAPGFGWGRMGDKVRSSERAVLLEYHGRNLWISKRNLVIYQARHYAKTFAIESAKQYYEDRRQPLTTHVI